MSDSGVKPHEAYDDLYEVEGWSFSIDPTEDGSLEYVDRAIRAWTAWRAFLVQKLSEEDPNTLF